MPADDVLIDGCVGVVVVHTKVTHDFHLGLGIRKLVQSQNRITKETKEKEIPENIQLC